jgi:CRP-like cAMP-binding protein
MSTTDEGRTADALERISRILAGILLRGIEDSDQVQKITRLKGCGFDNAEIAEMLGTTSGTVGVAIHRTKKRKKGGRKKRKAAQRRG